MIDWVNENWMRDVGDPARQEPDPVSELLALARGHAVFCRRDIARVVMALRVEFSGHDHPVGREIERIMDGAVERIARLIRAGRRDGSIPPGPPARTTALGTLRSARGRGDRTSPDRPRTTSCSPPGWRPGRSGSQRRPDPWAGYEAAQRLRTPCR